MNKGQMLHDFSILDELAYKYKKRIIELVSLLQFKIVVFDCDGTLTAFQYTPSKLLPCKEDELEEYSKEHNIYDNARVLKTMKYVISRLEPDNVFILTNSYNTIVDKKNSMILSNFSTIKKENIIHTKSAEEKIEKLKELYVKYGKQIIFVEDTATNLQLAEENLNLVV